MEVDAVAQLRAAVEAGDVAATAAALAAGADPNSLHPVVTGLRTAPCWRVVHTAAHSGHADCLHALLAAGADPRAVYGSGWTALHDAAIYGHTACAGRLLEAGADPAARSESGWTPLHSAAAGNSPTATALLLDAAPQASLAQDGFGRAPVEVALEEGSFASARRLLESQPALPPAAGLLTAAQSDWQGGGMPPSLYVPLVARQPLTSAEWARVPSPCPSLGAALPAVLARSEAEAALLVRHLPRADRERLRVAALSVRLTQNCSGVHLPAELAAAALALGMAE